MKAIAVKPGVRNSAHLVEMTKPSAAEIPDGRGVLVKVLRVGVDGTDKEINNAEYGAAPHGIDGDVVGDTEQPAARIRRHPFVRPGLERADHGLLHGFLGEADMGGTEQPRQAGHHAARLMSEEMLDIPAFLRRQAD